jgi:MFS family permease
VLSVGLLGLIAGCASQYGLAYLIPALRAEGLALEAATTLVIAPVFGVLVALIAWGAAADRWGERLVLTLGLAGAGVALLAAAELPDPLQRWICLFLAGASGAAIHAASGRLILGWFDVRERGLAMGIRQTGQPLGVAGAALVLPPLATLGLGAALGPLATVRLRKLA